MTLVRPLTMPAATPRSSPGWWPWGWPWGWAEAAPGLLALLLGLAGFAALFRTEIAAAVQVWFASTAYSHCFFVLPIAGWLVWDRRTAARGLRPLPTAWPALAVLPCALAWFVAERLGIMEGRQLAALGMVEALAVALLGWRLARAFAAPLAYLVFLVPFGSFLVPDLQAVTAWCVDTGLEVLDIPHVVDAFTIEIPEGTFYVAEACAGLRFLIAAVAFGALYACLTYRSPWRRLAFLAASCVVPVAANGMRALGIVVAGHIIGNAEAATADHLIYGWGFFSAVILLLTLAGLPFRQDTRPLPAVPVASAVASAVAPSVASANPGRAPATHTLAAAAVVVALAAIAPAGARLLDRADAAPALALPGFVATADCLSLGDAPNSTTQRFRCAGVALTATVQALPAHATPAALRAARAAATGEQDAADAVTSTLVLDGVTPRRWRVVELHDPDRMTATAAWIDGAPDPGGLGGDLGGRLRMAWQSVAGGARPPILLAASLAPPALAHAEAREAARHLLRDFLQAQTPLLQAVAAAGR
jgi:exosortase A